ncbi:hypothetical protein D3C73_18110 [compost metagenome]
MFIKRAFRADFSMRLGSASVFSNDDLGVTFHELDLTYDCIVGRFLLSVSHTSSLP